MRPTHAPLLLASAFALVITACSTTVEGDQITTTSATATATDGGEYCVETEPGSYYPESGMVYSSCFEQFCDMTCEEWCGSQLLECHETLVIPESQPWEQCHGQPEDIPEGDGIEPVISVDCTAPVYQPPPIIGARFRCVCGFDPVEPPPEPPVDGDGSTTDEGTTGTTGAEPDTSTTSGAVEDDTGTTAAG